MTKYFAQIDLKIIENFTCFYLWNEYNNKCKEETNTEQKEIFKMFGLTISAIIATASLFTTIPQNSMGFYPMTTIVTEVNYNSDEVTCTDSNGNDWVFTECEDWNEGDICSMIMCDNGTEIIYDDIIISERYNGCFDSWENH